LQYTYWRKDFQNIFKNIKYYFNEIKLLNNNNSKLKKNIDIKYKEINEKEKEIKKICYMYNNFIEESNKQYNTYLAIEEIKISLNSPYTIFYKNKIDTKPFYELISKKNKYYPTLDEHFIKKYLKNRKILEKYLKMLKEEFDFQKEQFEILSGIL